ncbi:MAG: hypothetical protein VYC34_10590 [Planctomycetota bacterium]|nr:hypothetical protein [Planctomycetota bacterium]
MRTHALAMFAAAAATAASAGNAGAVLVELTANGMVTSIDGGLLAPFDTLTVGDEWQITARYETDTPPVPGQVTATTALYSSAVTEISVLIDGIEAVHPGTEGDSFLSVQNDFDSAGPDRDGFSIARDVNDRKILLGMMDFDQTALDSIEPPSAFDFSEFDEALFALETGEFPDEARLEGSVANVTLRIIPAPAATTALLLTPALVACRRRRQS